MLRRAVAAIGIATMALSSMLATAGLAGEDTQRRTYLDRFEAQSYGGNDGTHDWSGPWKEIGESDGARSGGAVWVWPHPFCSEGYCLKIGGDEDLEETGVLRRADVAGATRLRLSYDVRRHLLDDDAEARAKVRISGDGGRNWKTLQTYPMDRGDAATRSESFLVTEFAGPKTVVAFIVTGDAEDAYITFDNIQLAARFDDVADNTSTTTTTTQPPSPTTTTTTTTTTEPPASTTTSPPAPLPEEPPRPDAPAADATADAIDEARFTSKDTMAVTAIGRNLLEPDGGTHTLPDRSPIDVMASTVEIAAGSVRSFALETFFLGLFIAWISLRGLSHVGSHDELLDGNAEGLR